VWLNVPKDDKEAKERFGPIMRFAGKVYTAVAFVGATGDAATAIEMASQALGITSGA
jgi:hypothetical protein